MSRLRWAVLALAAPLAALALALPAGASTALSPAWAAGLPLLWAALIVSLGGAPDALLALGISLPFSAWSLLYCSVWALAPRPLALDVLELLAAAALFLSASLLARFRRRSARLIALYALFIAGIELQSALGPLAALALAACMAALAALTRPRPEGQA
jgi:hypothetical protein